MFLFGPVSRAVLGGDVHGRVHGVSGHGFSAATAEAPSRRGSRGRGPVKWPPGGEAPTLCLRAVAMAARAVAPAGVSAGFV